MLLGTYLLFEGKSEKSELKGLGQEIECKYIDKDVTTSMS
jgi:hypothetical protein